MTESWAAGSGYKGLDKDIEDNTQDYGPRRFWLKPDTSTDIIFLDDNPLRFYEHSVCINGKWAGNTATCTQESDCPLCAIGDKPAYVGVWSVVDRSQWKDKKGIEHKDELRLFVAKSKVMTKLSRRSEKFRAKQRAKGVPETGLTGIIFEVTRGDGKSASTGDDFETKAKAKQELLDKYELPDYMAILKPNVRRLEQLARGVSTTARSRPEDKSSSAGDDDDIPW